MKKDILIFIYGVAISFQCYGQSQTQDNEFAKFLNKITKAETPIKYKVKGNYQELNHSYVVLLEEAKKYLGYSTQDYYITEYDYDMDEDIISNIRQVENPPFADNKIIREKYIILIYHRYSNSGNIIECDTLVKILSTFTESGTLIDKIAIQGHNTREEDWKDVVFLENNVLRIFDYKPNLENYNIKGGIYYIIDEEQPRTVVEINDYQIDKNGKIVHIKTHPQKYLKEFVDFYRSYQPNSDDPMNEYDK